MPFVKLDCGMLDSSLWSDRDARDMFITALLMASPYTLETDEPQIKAGALEETGWIVPAGRYGIVPGSGVSISAKCGLDKEAGIAALERLGGEDVTRNALRSALLLDSSGGNFMVRIDGGYLILDFERYRARDVSASSRMKKYRNRAVIRNGYGEHSVTRNRYENRTVTTAVVVSVYNITTDSLVGCFNQTFHRRVTALPSIRERVEARIISGVEPWMIVALPILVEAQGLDERMRKALDPAILLRDGKHARTTSSGYTTGATNWLERAFLRADITIMDLRLYKIAVEYGVADKLLEYGVKVANHSALAEPTDQKPYVSPFVRNEDGTFGVVGRDAAQDAPGSTIDTDPRECSAQDNRIDPGRS